jgi:hypothetical protein
VREAKEYTALNQCKNLLSCGCSPTINNLQQERQVPGQFLVWFILMGIHLFLGYPMFLLPFGMYYTLIGECVYHSLWMLCVLTSIIQSIFIWISYIKLFFYLMICFTVTWCVFCMWPLKFYLYCLIFSHYVLWKTFIPHTCQSLLTESLLGAFS